MPDPIQNPLYYLDNFQQVVDWVGAHHRDLLTDAECGFLDGFAGLPVAARALLVRMVMRKGDLFRVKKLAYAEIGCPLAAAAPLVERGWVNDQPMLDARQLCGLLTKHELMLHLGPKFAQPCPTKAGMLASLQAQDLAPARFAAWCPTSDDVVLRLEVDAFCERLRLMFFGNAHQDWSEFVLADLGIYRYEKVAFSPGSRVFGTRQDVDDYLHLQRCRERLAGNEPLAAVLAQLPLQAHGNAWVEARRQRLQFRLAMQYERSAELATALRLHSGNGHPLARLRAVRVLERMGEVQSAFDLASQAQAMPQDEAEAQQLMRVLPRLSRKLGQAWQGATPLATPPRIDLTLPAPSAASSVEHVVRDHLSTALAPVYYVENGLLNALFCLLCWDAVYAAVPGAFFHPFHAAPADLHQPDFYARRESLFEACLARLDTPHYRECILRTYREKEGVQSSFLAWGVLGAALVEQALDCLPAAHLKVIFRRLLRDIANNRSGFPDLIQFWPAQRRYRMIEVKGPGDRLQDNQRRWLDYFSRQDIPVTVAYVQWSEPP